MLPVNPIRRQGLNESQMKELQALRSLVREHLKNSPDAAMSLDLDAKSERRSPTQSEKDTYNMVRPGLYRRLDKHFQDPESPLYYHKIINGGERGAPGTKYSEKKYLDEPLFWKWCAPVLSQIIAEYNVGMSWKRLNEIRRAMKLVQQHRRKNHMAKYHPLQYQVPSDPPLVLPDGWLRPDQKETTSARRHLLLDRNMITTPMKPPRKTVQTSSHAKKNNGDKQSSTQHRRKKHRSHSPSPPPRRVSTPPSKINRRKKKLTPSPQEFEWLKLGRTNKFKRVKCEPSSKGV